MSKRRNSALAVLALAAAAVFVLPASSASAGSATTPNACANSVTANFSQIGVTTNGDDGLTTVAPGGATTSTGLSQQGAVPGAIFVAGYNLGLLVVGPNTIPTTVTTKIEAHQHDPGHPDDQRCGRPPTSVRHDDDHRIPTGPRGPGMRPAPMPRSTRATTTCRGPPAPAARSTTGRTRSRRRRRLTPTTRCGSHAVVGGFLNVTFRCAPGTVTPDRTRGRSR